jgi:YVTN family beta-propeller protein
MRPRYTLGILLLTLCAAAATVPRTSTLLPSGWRLSAPEGATATTGTMPQGIALSPNGSLLAVVESGVNPPALRIFEIPSLHERAAIPLPGAFGKPVWKDAAHVLVPGANADAVFDVDVRSDAVARAMSLPKGTWPAAVALGAGGTIAAVGDGDGAVHFGNGTTVVLEQSSHEEAHPGDALFDRSGKILYVAVRGENAVAAIPPADPAAMRVIPVALHPAALALSDDGSKLYVAESDDDAVGVVQTRTDALSAQISVALHDGSLRGYGASPNALLVHGDELFVSLGGENAVALVRGNRLVERIPAGWFPTGLAMSRNGTLYIANGLGERAPANPQFDPLQRGSPGYVGSITVGSIRSVPRFAYARAHQESLAVLDDARPVWTPLPAARTALRANGPIRHVIYIIKENRTYDQILGDLPGADGDPALAMFGERVTPNQHAIARRFGVFDNAYTNAQVSADGHNWTDAAFANDYVNRFWPPNYGGRRKMYDFQDGSAPDVPHDGYLWDDAKRAGVSYRDYGEDIDFAPRIPLIGINTFPGLTAHFDPGFVGWDLRYGDAARFAEWDREFRDFVAHGNLPQLEIVYFPNDHTAGTAPGMPTPQAYIGMNDWMVGRLVDAVSHSPYWRSTAIFALEDDAQNGPDHVSDQRSTFYVASPYARGGLQHAHYSTASFVHTIELLLGLAPLSIYDATARPLYDAFALTPVNLAPYDAVKPSIDLQATNTKTAYGAAISARMDFRHPDEADPRELNDILMHSGERDRR